MLDSPNYFSPTAESSASVTQISLFARPGRGGSKRQVFSQTRQQAAAPTHHRASASAVHLVQSHRLPLSPSHVLNCRGHRYTGPQITRTPVTRPPPEIG